MIAAWLLGGALCMATGDDGNGPPGADPAYEAAAVAAGRDAAAHVDLALWCEARGMAAEKSRHLARAVLLDPDDQRARGLLGQVKRDGRWMRTADVARSVEESPDQKALLDEYLELRARTKDKADDQYKLALWCEEKGLAEPMVAHLRRALKLDPGREGAWRRLGFKKVGGRWVNPEVEAAAKARREARATAYKEWTPRLEKLRDGLASRDKAKRSEALAALAEVDDPRAVPSVWKVFARGGNEARQSIAARIFGRMEGADASAALATLAVFSPSAGVRADAASLLRQRDPREFAGLLASFLRDEVKYRVKTIRGVGETGELLVEGKDANVRRVYTPAPPPDPAIRSLPVDSSGYHVARMPGYLDAVQTAIPITSLLASGELDSLINPPPALAALSAASPAYKRVIEGIGAGSRSAIAGALSPDAVYLPYSVTFTPAQLADELARDSSTANIKRLGGPNVWRHSTYGVNLHIPVAQMIAEAKQSSMIAREQIAGDVAMIEAYNAPIRETNERAAAVLKDIAEGADFGTDGKRWTDWAFELEGRGYVFQSPSSPEPPPTIVEQVPVAFQPQASPFTRTFLLDVAYMPSATSCFAGGTLVRTLQGDRPIESIRPGDLVLSQDVTTGKLAFKAVVEAFHNPPNWTYDVDLGAEVVRPTGIHRFWKAGHGWVMARDLRPGDRLRAVGGTAEVRSVAKGEQKVPVFNLLIADADSYHVGALGLLAHDNGFVEPVAAPFDAVLDAAELVAASKP